MSLNVTRTALDVIGVGRIYYNQQEKDEGPWSKTIGPFLCEKNERNANIVGAIRRENTLKYFEYSTKYKVKDKGMI